MRIPTRRFKVENIHNSNATRVADNLPPSNGDAWKVLETYTNLCQNLPVNYFPKMGWI